MITPVVPAGPGSTSASSSRLDPREELLNAAFGLVEVMNASRNAVATEQTASGIAQTGPLGSNLDVVS